MSVDHYENFPVASWLCPPSLRPTIEAIYRFARTADDLADEGDATPARRLADLDAYRSDLHAAHDGVAVSARWPEVFEPLRAAMRRHLLPVVLLDDLLGAFSQDVVKHTYADRGELIDYCRRSANPVGRLVLHLHGVVDAGSLRQSDSICTALQLANFWQDLHIDTGRGRLYLPATDCAQHGVAAADLLSQRDSPAVRGLVADMVCWTRRLLRDGAPLVHAVPGRAGWELRLVVQGGQRILERIEGLGFATLQSRPTLHWHDAPILLWRAVSMRAVRSPLAGESA